MSLDIQKISADPYNYAQNLTVPNLVKLLRKLSLAYYTDTPLVTDNVFDILESVLKERDAKNKFFDEIGYDMSNDKTKVVLPYPLYSLDKIKTVESWIKKFLGPYMLSDKLDGISGLLYKNKKVLQLFTRGDGKNGQDISHLIPYVLKDYDFSKLPEHCAIRGELVISRENYATVKDKYLDHRSCIAGMVNSKKIALVKEKDKEQLAKLTDFVAYEVVHPRHKIDTQFEMLQKWNFPSVHHKLKQNITNESLSKYLTKRRNTSKYYIDGIVVGDCGKSYELFPDSNPDYAFAFKLVFGDQIFETKVRHIEWDVSKDGYIKPVVILDPVVINGITVSRVTGNNAKYIITNRIGSGTVLKIIRSGDVIPKIVKVVSDQVDNPQMPNIKYKWTDTGVDLIAIETNKATTNSMTIKKITFFFTSMGVQFIGEGIVTKLVDADYDSIEKILKADLKDLSKIDGLGTGVLTKIFESIRVVFETTDLATLMAASGIFGRNMGKRRIEVVVKAIPTIMNETADANLSKKIDALEGFSTITTKQFVDGLNKFKDFFKMLMDIKTISVGHLLTIKKDDKDKKVGGIFTNMKFVFTGPRNKKIKDFIEANGGEVTDGVRKTTNMLLCESTNESGSASYVKANALGIVIMFYADFEKKYMS